MKQSTALSSERIRDYGRLSRAEVASLLSLSDAGKSQVEIAQILGCDQSNISRWLSKLRPTTDLAKHRLQNAALELTERLIESADAEQSLEVLDRLDVLSKKRDNGAQSGVQVFIGMPSQPIGPDPLTIDLSPAVTRELPE